MNRKDKTTERTEKYSTLTGEVFLPEEGETNKEFPLKNLTKKIISCAIEVHSSLGPGLFENLYEEAMAYELTSQGIVYQRQKILKMQYKGNFIGDYKLDFLIENKVIVELKCVESIKNIHIAQILTYMTAEKIQIGLLINFNVEQLKEGIRRIIR